MLGAESQEGSLGSSQDPDLAVTNGRECGLHIRADRGLNPGCAPCQVGVCRQEA